MALHTAFQHGSDVQQLPCLADIPVLLFEKKNRSAGDHLQSGYARKSADEIVGQPRRKLTPVYFPAKVLQRQYGNTAHRGPRATRRGEDRFNELRHVAAGIKNDAQTLTFALRAIVLIQLAAKPAEIDAHDRINPGIEIRSAIEHLDAEDNFLQAGGLSLQCASDAEFEQPDELWAFGEEF